MRIERWARARGPGSHKHRTEGLAIDPDFNEEVSEQKYNMARAQMFSSSLTSLIPTVMCLLLAKSWAGSRSDVDLLPQGLMGMYELSLLHKKELKGSAWSEPQE